MSTEEIVKAVRYGDVKAVETYLNEGGDPNAIDTIRHGESLLSACAQTSDRLDIPKLLINAGADVNHQDYDGKTPLHFGNNREAFCRFLIENGADIDLRCNLGRLPQDDNQHTPEDRRVNLGELRADIESQILLQEIEEASEPTHPNPVRVRM